MNITSLPIPIPRSFTIDQHNNIISGYDCHISMFSPHPSFTPQKMIIRSTKCNHDNDNAPISQINFNSTSAISIDWNGDIVFSDTLSIYRVQSINGVTSVFKIAGSGQQGFNDGSGDQAMFDWPFGLAIDCDSSIFVADYFNDRIRHITNNNNNGSKSPSSSSSHVTTIAGDGTEGYQDGNSSITKLNEPFNIAISRDASSGDKLIAFSDCGNHCIRGVIPSQSRVFTIAGIG